MSNEARKKDENRREAYASKRMHSFVLCSFLTFVLVASILPVQSAMATDVVFDDFSGTTLETTRWSVLKGGSYINVGDGELDMTSDGHKRIDSIATFGPGNSAETRMKLNGDYQKFGFRINPHGYSPTIVGFYFDTLEAAYGGEEDYIHALVWEKTSEGMTKLLDQSIPATWNEWHIFEIVWKSDEVLFLVDDVTSASVSFAYSGNLPVGFWNDRSSTMLVDWVLVTPLVGLTLDQISTDFSISANDFCTEHNE
ncbi:MAG: hypothetical protein KAW09_07235, partial [Thermoplasmata archaeon]|nr:hypothetical protein [Thermoplasmata archaeon]